MISNNVTKICLKVNYQRKLQNSKKGLQKEMHVFILASQSLLLCILILKWVTRAKWRPSSPFVCKSAIKWLINFSVPSTSDRAGRHEVDDKTGRDRDATPGFMRLLLRKCFSRWLKFKVNHGRTRNYHRLPKSLYASPQTCLCLFTQKGRHDI